MQERTKSLTLTVNVCLEQAGEQDLPELMAHAFDTTGRHLAAVAVPKGAHGQVQLKLPGARAGSTVRVVVAPVQPEQTDDVPKWMEVLIRREAPRRARASLPELLRKGGVERRTRLTLEGGEVSVLIPEGTLGWSYFTTVVVRGRVIKRIPLPDGTMGELGVSNACVKIYEVDKIYRIIARLPDLELLRVRDDLWRLLKDPPPEPLPEPPLVVVPHPSPMERAAVGHVGVLTPAPAVATPVIPLPPPRPRRAMADAHADSAPAPVSVELEPIFRATSAAQLRSELLARANLLAPYLCCIGWPVGWFHTDLIKHCHTAEDGRFETTIKYPGAGDRPDLYFQVVQWISSTLHILYDPGVACHTHWDYPSGEEVVLVTDDPAAITSAPQDPVELPVGVTDWIMPYAVGAIRLDQITPGGLAVEFKDASGTWVDTPFGSTLGLRLGYTDEFPLSGPGKPSYYRWQFTRLDDTGAETGWTEFVSPFALPVVRHYVDQDLAHPELPPTFPAYLLGPHEKAGMHLYEFKPHQLEQPAGHAREWPVDDWFGDIYSGLLESTLLPGGVLSAAGLYKLKLEIYDEDGGLVAPGPGTFDFIVPTGVDEDGTTTTRRAISGAPEGNEIEDGGFVFTLRIDNNPCEAVIYEASVDGTSAGRCGFIASHPHDDVHLSFKARHPNGFARFVFTTVRGSSGPVADACAPASPGATTMTGAPLVTDTPNGFSRDVAGVFSKDVDEADLLGTCERAAFGENLYVAATATNGRTRLWWLDASAPSLAFALDPKAIKED